MDELERSLLLDLFAVDALLDVNAEATGIFVKLAITEECAVDVSTSRTHHLEGVVGPVWNVPPVDVPRHGKCWIPEVVCVADLEQRLLDDHCIKGPHRIRVSGNESERLMNT